MRMTFTGAERINEDQDGIQVLFTYKRSDSDQPHTIHATASPDTQLLSDDEVQESMQELFAGVIAYLEDYWRQHQELPAEDTELQAGKDFQLEDHKTALWTAYILELD